MSFFSQFNTERLFDIDDLTFRTHENDNGEVVTTYLSPAQLYEEDGCERIEHEVVGIYKKHFSQETLESYPNMPAYRYTLAIHMPDDTYVYLNAPTPMNEKFDQIMADQAAIKMIQKGKCIIFVEHFTKRNGDELLDRYAIKFA